MKLLRTEPQALSAALHAQVDTLLRTAFDLTGPYDYVTDRAEVVLLLDDAGRTVAHAATYRRPISVGDETVTVGMIGGVAIDPAERRHGHLRTLIAEVHRHFNAEALPFSLLFAFVPAVYRSSGYREMTNITRSSTTMAPGRIWSSAAAWWPSSAAGAGRTCRSISAAPASELSATAARSSTAG